MARILDYAEYSLGTLLYSVRGHDNKRIIKTPAFKNIPEPNMTVEVPDCGPSGSQLLDEHTCIAPDGNVRFPNIRWTSPCGKAADAEMVKEQILLCEDPDTPIPGVLIDHGIFYRIPPQVHEAGYDQIAAHDSAVPGSITNPNAESHVTRAGWKYIPTHRGTSWIGAGAPLGHGVHRYTFTVIALNEQLEFGHAVSVTKQDLEKAIVGKVVGWGQWVGTFERPWPK